MLMRFSLVIVALAMLATPVWAQDKVPSGRQELAEQKQGDGEADRPQTGQGQQGGQAQQGQRGQADGERNQVRPAQPQRDGQPQAQAQRGSGEIDVAQLSQMFILGNHAEVELGNLALEKSQNESVREFAQMMVKDHTAFIAKLNKFAGVQNKQPVRTDRPSTTTGVRPQATVGHDAMAELGRKSAELELSMTKQMLSQYEGQDFDMGYLGQQMVAHTKMLACLTAAKDVGPEDFQATIAEGLATTREHMQHGKQLAASIKNKEYGEGERRESARPDLRGGDRPDGAIRDGERKPVRDGGARPAVRPQDGSAPREGVPPRGNPQGASGDRADDQGRTDGAPDSARDREDITP